MVVATTPQTVFRQLDMSTAERVRPDVALVPVPFLRYPGTGASVARRSPELSELVDAYLSHDLFGQRELIALADRRPVLFELDTEHVRPKSYPALLPSGALYRVRDHSMQVAWPERLADHERTHVELLRSLGAARSEPDAKALLLWLRYTDALYFAAIGQRQAATRSLAAAEELAPEDKNVLAMKRALAESKGEGVFDVEPFLRLD